MAGKEGGTKENQACRDSSPLSSFPSLCSSCAFERSSCFPGEGREQWKYFLCFGDEPVNFPSDTSLGFEVGD